MFGRATKTIILLNCAIAAAGAVLTLVGRTDYVHAFLTLRVADLFAGAWWEFFTSMWVHAPVLGLGLMHILFNMMTLSVFGKFVEGTIGVARYLFLYFAAGFVANLFFIAEAVIRAKCFGDDLMLNVSVMGASGAVCGVIGTFAVFSPQTKLYVMFIPVPIKAMTVVWGLIVISTILMLTSTADIIAHSAHLGGVLTGLLYGYRLKRNHR